MILRKDARPLGLGDMIACESVVSASSLLSRGKSQSSLVDETPREGIIYDN